MSVNSLKSNDVYESVNQAIIGAKSLSEPMLNYYLLELRSVKSKQNTTISIQENQFENVVCGMAAISSNVFVKEMRRD